MFRNIGIFFTAPLYTQLPPIFILQLYGFLCPRINPSNPEENPVMEINVDTAAGLRMTGYGIISCQGDH